MKQLFWAPAARGGVEAIEAYITQRDPRAARAVARKIRERADFLREFPFAGSPLGIGDFRKLSVGRYPYMLIYRLRGSTVEIVRVHHSAQDWAPQ